MRTDLLKPPRFHGGIIHSDFLHVLFQFPGDLFRSAEDESRTRATCLEDRDAAVTSHPQSSHRGNRTLKHFVLSEAALPVCLGDHVMPCPEATPGPHRVPRC
jgi:hypothetical protein